MKVEVSNKEPGGAERDKMEKRFLQIAEQLKEAQAKAKFFKREADKAAEQLKEMCGDQTTSFKGYTYQRIERAGSIKYNLIPELKKIDLEQYRGTKIISWRLKYEEQF